MPGREISDLRLESNSCQIAVKHCEPTRKIREREQELGLRLGKAKGLAWDLGLALPSFSLPLLLICQLKLAAAAAADNGIALNNFLAARKVKIANYIKANKETT